MPNKSTFPNEFTFPNASTFLPEIMEKRIESVTKIITYLEAHLDIFHLLMANNDDNLFERHMSSYYLEKYFGKNTDRKERYRFLYYAIGSFTLIHQWIADKCPCPPRELAELICEQSENAKNLSA